MNSPVAPASAEQVAEGRERILAELRKVIVGQDEVVEQVLIALFTGGHVLITGVPGLAKTLLIKTLSDILDLDFKRIQFTPDLMPSDITGTEILDEEQGTRRLRFVKGPIFGQIILADEINRTPPKTQAALLEAMQEYHVTASGRTYPLELPFFVLATQNPIELEGTYPLPEAQLDRFMFNIFVDYPKEEEEFEIVRKTTARFDTTLRKMLSGADIVKLQAIVRDVPVSDHVIRYAMRLARSSRPTNPDAPAFVKEWVSWGAGPRASQYLILGGKARAVLEGRYYVSADDVRAVAHPVLRHRIITNFNAEAEGITPDKVVDKLIEITPDKEGEKAVEPDVKKAFQ
jgi:MoxR-like ATPase